MRYVELCAGLPFFLSLPMNKTAMVRRQMNTTYSTSIELNLRIQKTMFPLVVTLTLLANAIFAVCSLSKIEGIYTLLVYLIILQLLFEIVERRNNQIDAKELDDDPDLQLPFFDNVLPYVAIWLLWWIATTLLFHAMVVFTHGVLAQLVLVFLLGIFVTLRYVLQLKTTSLWVMMVRFFLHVVSCALTFFPTRDWAPQHTSWMATFVRVTLFFLASIAFNTIVGNYVGRIRDNLVLVWWILITPFYTSLIVLPVLIAFVFFTQTKLKLIFEPKTTTSAAVAADQSAATDEHDIEKNNRGGSETEALQNVVGNDDNDKTARRHAKQPVASAAATNATSTNGKHSRSSSKAVLYSSTTTLQAPAQTSSRHRQQPPQPLQVVVPAARQKIEQPPETVVAAPSSSSANLVQRQVATKVESPRLQQVQSSVVSVVAEAETKQAPTTTIAAATRPKQAEKVSSNIELI